jgi:hypothetical protein
MTVDLAITQDEIATACNPENRIIDVAGTHLDSVTVLKLAFGSGDIEAVSLDKTATENLIAVLKSLVPYFDAIEGTEVTVDTITGQATAKSPHG